jgi:ribonuclease BN (tRNA processing enzyme)
MKIRVLGCHGSELPGYNTTSFLIDGKVLIDAGTVTSVLTAEEQLKIDYILVTHAHMDHVRDIMFLADNISYLKKETPLFVLSTSYVIKTLRKFLFNNIIWPDFSSIPDTENPVIKFVAIDAGQTISISGLEITAIKVHHAVETVGYAVEAPEGAAIFVGDTGPTEEIWQYARKIKGLEAIFVETSLPDGMKNLADMTGHLTPASLDQELKKLAGLPAAIYLYHMKLQLRETIKKEITRLNHRHIHTLEDGQVLQIGAR